MKRATGVGRFRPLASLVRSPALERRADVVDRVRGGHGSTIWLDDVQKGSVDGTHGRSRGGRGDVVGIERKIEAVAPIANPVVRPLH